MKNPILLGFLASLFFAVTFVLNRSMSLQGGSWIWSSSLRFYWMLLFFLIIVLCRKNLKPLLLAIKRKPLPWLLWSTIGFGLFYSSLTYAAAFSPSWLVASTWQITIIAGMILAPFISKNNQAANTPSTFLFTGIILLGIIVMQLTELKSASAHHLLTGIFWVGVAAFAYPLGNRKMMQVADGTLDVFQRILGMVICSLPFWFILNGIGFFTGHSFPSRDQLVSTFVIGVFSGVVATTLFFAATDKVKNNQRELAAVEATQSTQVLFALAGEVLLLQAALPGLNSFIGVALVVLGMVLHSLKKQQRPKPVR